MKARIIYNPIAGQRDVRAEISLVVGYLQSQGWDVEANETHTSGDATRYAEQAVREGCQVAFAAGGDGTLNEVVNGAIGSDMAIGTLPVGTANVWAREIGLPVWSPLHPHRLVETVKLLEEGLVYSVDVGRANGRYFLLWAGIGFDAQVMEQVEPHLEIKRRLGAIPFIIEGMALALSFVGTRASMVIGNRTFRQRVIMILVSNTQSYGGGVVRAVPDACLDDGCLDVCVFRGIGPLSTVRHAVGLLTQHHLHDPQVSFHQTSYLRIGATKPLPVHVDGIPFGHTPLEVTLAVRSVKVLVPRRVRRTLFMAENAEGTPLQDLAQLPTSI